MNFFKKNFNRYFYFKENKIEYDFKKCFTGKPH